MKFQPAKAAVVRGHVADVGRVFGLRTNDLWYGWNVDSSAGAFERDYRADQRLNTGIKMQPEGEPRFWEVLVPDGIYDVVLAAGDPAETNGLTTGTRYSINVENQPVIREAVPGFTQWSFNPNRHMQVQVSDGRLTIASGEGAMNNSIAFVEIQQVAPIYWGAALIDNNCSHKCPMDYHGESDPGILGYYEGHTGKKISLLHFGDSWMSRTGYKSFNSQCRSGFGKMWARGTIPYYSWSPAGGGETNFSLLSIIEGRHDAFLRKWFSQAKAYGKPFFLNFAREMNGKWYLWSEAHSVNEGCPPGSFTNMWRHVHDICVKEVGCTNISWVWAVDRDLANASHLQPISSFYPGHDYVDWLGMDLYNAGQVPPYTGEPFLRIYGTTYSNLTRLAPSKPIMVCETATKDLAATPKPLWIAEALSVLPSAFPQIRGFLWFNWNDRNPKKSWPIEGGDNLLPYTTAPVDWVSVSAFSNGIASPFYLPNIFANQSNVLASPIQPITILNPPARVDASVCGEGVSVNWSSVPGATGYGVYRCSSNSPVALRGRATGTNFVDREVTKGTACWYFVRAQNLAGESLSSSEGAMVAPEGIPGKALAPPPKVGYANPASAEVTPAMRFR